MELSQIDDFVRTCRSPQFKRRTVGYTCGAFDIFHAGHADLLTYCMGACDYLIIGVNTDDSIRRYKSPYRPINPYPQRAFVVEAFCRRGTPTDVIPLPYERPTKHIERWMPDIYFKGGDYILKPLHSRELVEGYGGRVLLLPGRFPTSTTQIIDKICRTQMNLQHLQ